MTDKICPDCDGEGKLERYHRDGCYDVPCPYCYNSCGMVPSSEEEEADFYVELLNHYEEECLVYNEDSEDFFKDRELDK
jgi:hypothetical protein